MTFMYYATATTLLLLQAAWITTITPIGNNKPLRLYSCKQIPEEYKKCESITGRESTHSYRQFLPGIGDTEIQGYAVDIAFIVLGEFDPPLPPECTTIAHHFLCFAAVPPCEPQSSLPMLICNESCEAYKRLLSVDFCKVLDDHLRAVQQTSSLPAVKVLVEKYFAFDCDNVSTYIFDPSISEFSETCLQPFKSNLQEQILSRPSCQRVPSGPCRSKQLAETGYYFSDIGRDATAAVFEVVAPSESNNSSALSSCQISLLKLACDYYYPPCDPVTFQQRTICDASCEIVSLIQTTCPSKIGNSSVLDEILHLDCSDPTSYLVENLTVSQDQCIDVSAYAMESPVQTNFAYYAIGISLGLFSIIVLCIVLIGCFVWVRTKGNHKPDTLARVYRDSNRIVESYMLDVGIRREGSDDYLDNEVIRLSEIEMESYLTSFSSVLISHKNLVQTEKIGEGAFAKVYRGELLQPQSSDKKMAVAIKTMKNVTSQEELKAFLSESLIMKDFSHPNVLGLVGVCFDAPDGYPFLILPFMVNGSLKEYLKKNRVHVTDIDTYPKGLELPVLIGMCMDIACGMAYLAEERFVHRDLASRNCMVDDNLRIKVGDFGLARDVYDSDYYRAKQGARLPVKWMPPEALHDGISNEKTDVWSFGVTCWEVFSLGCTPYPTIPSHELVDVISSGVRLEKPTLCPQPMYKLVAHCWELLPGDRPTFSKLSSQFSDYWEEHHAYI